jgi:tetratricopeptide repeat protein
MSYKTIKAQPTNTTFLDTYAWVLFMQKKYAEALSYIDQALANDTDSVKSATVIEHAGDIYAMNGKTDQAIDYWKQALEIGGKNALISRKIKAKRYIKDSSKTNL